MKTIKNILIIILLLTSFKSIEAQNKNLIDTTTFKVSGVCGSCKSRIENAALIKGVKYANWDIKTHHLTVIYNTSKVKIDDIHKSIALAGHDTEKIKATDEAYSKLPKCCAYRDDVKSH